MVYSVEQFVLYQWKLYAPWKKKVSQTGTVFQMWFYLFTNFHSLSLTNFDKVIAPACTRKRRFLLIHAQAFLTSLLVTHLVKDEFLYMHWHVQNVSCFCWHSSQFNKPHSAFSGEKFKGMYKIEAQANLTNYSFSSEYLLIYVRRVFQILLHKRAYYNLSFNEFRHKTQVGKNVR